MKAQIVSYRRSRRVQSGNQMILTVADVSTRDKAEALVGKKVTFTTPSGTAITGTVASAHGNSGAVRARFEKGMPGQSLFAHVALE